MKSACRISDFTILIFASSPNLNNLYPAYIHSHTHMSIVVLSMSEFEKLSEEEVLKLVDDVTILGK